MASVLSNAVLTDAAIVTFGLSGDANQTKYTLLTTAAVGNSRTINYTGPTPADGETIVFEIIQDGVGSRTVTWGSAFVGNVTNVAPVLTVTASKRDLITAQWVAGLGKFTFTNVVKGI